jgi:hypothetical protein
MINKVELAQYLKEIGLEEGQITIPIYNRLNPE